ncbi:DMT family transporter [Frigoribacterium sp. UYMn621]|uniref:DMT family transporter n=1 Tax=Frigoribacterium sp. UYMn621 TaxID=3156343 RepID=UPI003399914B
MTTIPTPGVKPGAPQLSAPRLSTSVLIAIVVTLLAWSSAFIVIRGVAPHFAGGSLAFARLLVGTVVLSLLLIGHRWVRPTVREWVLIVVFGLSWFAAYNVALNISEQSLDAGTTAMIVGIGPVLIALGAGVFLGDGIPRWLAIGAGIAFLGVVLIGISSGITRIGDGAGVIWAIVAAVTYAIGVICQKPVLRRLPNRQVTFLGCAVGAVACLPFTGGLIHDLSRAPVTSILGAVYLGVVPTAIAFSTWAYALSKMSAGPLAVTTYIVPTLVVVEALLFFREVPAPLAIVGGVVCLVGVAVSRRRSRAPRTTIGS